MAQTVSGVPGASARAEYERRRRARVWSYIRLSLFVGAFVAAVGIGAGSQEPRRVMTFVALAAAVGVAREAWRLREPVEPWRVGAEGEERTARILERLVRKGYVVLHDRRIPGSRANIDHIVVGPSGVFTIETKSYRGRLKLKRSTVKLNGRRHDELVHQALRQWKAVDDVVGERVRVVPFVCVHGAEIRKRWFRGPVVDGVRFCSGKRLAKTLRRERSTLGVGVVDELVRILDARLPPSGP